MTDAERTTFLIERRAAKTHSDASLDFIDEEIKRRLKGALLYDDDDEFREAHMLLWRCGSIVVRATKYLDVEDDRVLERIAEVLKSQISQLKFNVEDCDFIEPDQLKDNQLKDNLNELRAVEHALTLVQRKQFPNVVPLQAAKYEDDDMMLKRVVDEKVKEREEWEQRRESDA
jgi:hypothetical protein